MPSAHAAVKHELLVRYLDAWTPAALHGHKRVTYVEDPPGESALAAARVFGEFADKMRGRAFTMVIATAYVEAARSVLEEYGSPAGLTVHPLDGPVLDALRDAHAMGAPIFAWFDGPTPTEVLSTVATIKGAEILLGSAAATDKAVTHLRSAGLRQTARVDLVDKSGTAESLVFGTASDKALEKFKDELWALDEYAGIRLRDPGDAEGTLLDIRVQPNLAPLDARWPRDWRRTGRPPWPSFACGRCTKRSSARPTRPRRCRRWSPRAAWPAHLRADASRWTLSSRCRIARPPLTTGWAYAGESTAVDCGGGAG